MMSCLFSFTIKLYFYYISENFTFSFLSIQINRKKFSPCNQISEFILKNFTWKFEKAGEQSHIQIECKTFLTFFWLSLLAWLFFIIELLWSSYNRSTNKMSSTEHFLLSKNLSDSFWPSVVWLFEKYFCSFSPSLITISLNFK